MSAFRRSASALLVPISALAYILSTQPSAPVELPVCLYNKCPQPHTVSLAAANPGTFSWLNLCLVIVAVQMLRWSLRAMSQGDEPPTTED
jgi:hypothetical protein